MCLVSKKLFLNAMNMVVLELVIRLFVLIVDLGIMLLFQFIYLVGRKIYCVILF